MGVCLRLFLSVINSMIRARPNARYFVYACLLLLLSAGAQFTITENFKSSAAGNITPGGTARPAAGANTPAVGLTRTGIGDAAPLQGSLSSIVTITAPHSTIDADPANNTRLTIVTEGKQWLILKLVDLHLKKVLPRLITLYP